MARNNSRFSETNKACTSCRLFMGSTIILCDATRYFIGLTRDLFPSLIVIG